MTVRELLMLARAKIAHGGHARGEYAFTADRRPCGPHDEEAVSFCARGAIYSANVGEFATFSDGAITALAGAIDPDWQSRGNHVVDFITRWNDAPEREVSDVLAAFDRAIEATS